MILKQGVSVDILKGNLIPVITFLDEYFHNAGKPFVITSTGEGVHKQGSLHYSGEAFDFRSRAMNIDQQHDLLITLVKKFSQDFDILLESDHFHVEWDPK